MSSTYFEYNIRANLDASCDEKKYLEIHQKSTFTVWLYSCNDYITLF